LASAKVTRCGTRVTIFDRRWRVITGGTCAQVSSVAPAGAEEQMVDGGEARQAERATGRDRTVNAMDRFSSIRRSRRC
jgi:hypothetical protein